MAFILFGNGIGGGFVLDDYSSIEKNQDIRSLGSIPTLIFKPFYNQPESGLYRPFTLVSYAFNYLFGSNPAGFHVVNIIIHGLNIFLIFVLARKLFSDERLAYLSSILFAVMPIHTEGVTYISGRADVLILFFSLLSLLFLDKEKYWTGAVFFLLGMLSKESGLGLIAVAVWWLWIRQGKNIKEVFYKLAPYWGAVALYFILRYIALKEYIFSVKVAFVYNPLASLALPARVFTALKIMLLYIYKTFIPFHLSSDYSYNQIPVLNNFFNLYVILGLLIFAGLLLLIFGDRTKKTALGLGAALLLAFYFIVSNFVLPIGTIMAERMFYASSAGIAVITATTIVYITRKKWVRYLSYPFLGLICIIYVIITVNRNNDWLNNVTLFESAVAQSPNSVHAMALLSREYMKINRWDKANPLAIQAYSIYPEHLPTLSVVGALAAHEGRIGDAISYYKKAFEINPEYQTAEWNLARLLMFQKKYGEAAELFGDLYHKEPSLYRTKVYALSLINSGKPKEAISFIGSEIKAESRDGDVLLILGKAYSGLGDKKTANYYFSLTDAKDISIEFAE
ncbi:MAG: hypothetical protein CEN90_344 [Parcubacteria group bacterium Licking1014_17]|nr:MAG: hypothetical protein CEN90_344 [Parcubacteria group bacterium Licking1014_17]